MRGRGGVGTAVLALFCLALSGTSGFVQEGKAMSSQVTPPAKAAPQQPEWRNVTRILLTCRINGHSKGQFGMRSVQADLEDRLRSDICDSLAARLGAGGLPVVMKDQPDGEFLEAGSLGVLVDLTLVAQPEDEARFGLAMTYDLFRSVREGASPAFYRHPPELVFLGAGRDGWRAAVDRMAADILR